MFIGEFSHTIDDKGRLSVPVKFRDQFAQGCVLTRGLDGCLWLYPASEWEKIAAKVAHLPITQRNARSFSRFILSGAMDVKVDKAGRINLPKYLSDYAEIDEKVVVAGMYDRVEIWSGDKWQSFKEEMEKNSEDVAEGLANLNEESF
ncbi:MAG TPA: division/cell wall cluster transcriptional repressor MraZ [bacterium]|nr:division/cell wall cluster transcriptional repressor MraZ [bacterium]